MVLANKPFETLYIKPLVNLFFYDYVHHYDTYHGDIFFNVLRSSNTLAAWNTGEATTKINAMAKSLRLTLVYTYHAQQQMDDRNLTTGDLLHVMKFGFVLEEPVPSTRSGLYKYSIEGRTPNSGSRKLKLIVIPDEMKCGIKFVTVMWKDKR